MTINFFKFKNRIFDYGKVPSLLVFNKVWILCFFFLSCSPSSYEDFRAEGDELAKDLAKELQEIQSLEELQIKSQKIRKKYLALARLVRAIREYDSENLGKHGFLEKESKASEKLCFQMKRLYEIPGAKEVMEKAQYDALCYLGKHVQTKRIKNQNFDSESQNTFIPLQKHGF